MKRNNLFWIGYSDLLTSLFFVMLVLFGITFLVLKRKNIDLKASADQLEQIKEIEKALESLDKEYFSFDSENKRYKLNIDVKFKPNSSNINDLKPIDLVELKNAGIELFNKISVLINENENIEYLLVIEGNAQRYCPGVNESECNYKRNPNLGYRLSYKRALSLVNFWKEESNIPFDQIKNNCEIMIAGSGYFGQSRDTIYEQNNRRFTIQVTSKVGKFLNRQPNYE